MLKMLCPEDESDEIAEEQTSLVLGLTQSE